MYLDNLEVEKKETRPSMKIAFVDQTIQFGILPAGEGFMLRGVTNQVFLKTVNNNNNAYCVNDGSLSVFPTHEEVIPVDIEFIVRKK